MVEAMHAGHRPIHPGASRQRGSTLIEVLIAMVVVAFGLLGLAGLQMKMQLSDMESYQRAQALVLLQDMLDRMSANRANAASYVTGGSTPLGYGATCPTDTSTLANTDLGQWCTQLQGAAENLGTSKTGAMLGARGCIENLNTNLYMITIAWQGSTSAAVPPASVDCGVNLYNSTSASCTADQCRRTVTTVLDIATLD